MQTRGGARLFGYDLFISFALGPPPRGTRSYASDLARRLRERDLMVFYSEEEALVGNELDSTLKNALHRSRILVVIANRATLAEPGWVQMEVEEFRRTHPDRPIIPINIGNALAAIPGAESWLQFSNRIWLDESQKAADEGIVTDAILERLVAAPTAMRASKRWRWTVTAAFAVLLIATAAALWFAWSARRNSMLASAQRMLAEDNAVRAHTNAVQARTNAAQARIHAVHATANEQLARRESSRAMAAEKKARTEADTARAAERKALSGRLAAESQLTRKSDPRLALLWAREAWSREPTLESRHALYEALNEPIPMPLEKIVPSSVVDTVDYSADGRFIAAVTPHLGELYLWNAVTRRVAKPPPGRTSVERIAFSPDGCVLAVLGKNGVLRLWDPATSTALGTPLAHPELSEGRSLAWRPDGRVIAVAGMAPDSSARIVLWDTESRSPFDEPLRPEAPKGRSIDSMSFSPDGRLLAAAMYTAVGIWNVTERQLHVPLIPTPMTTAAVMFLDEGFLAFDGPGHEATVWSIYGREPIGPSFDGHMSWVHMLAYAPEARIVATGSDDQTIRLWQSSGVPIGTPLVAHDNRITGLAFTADGSRLVSAAYGVDVIQWWLNTHSSGFQIQDEQRIESDGWGAMSVDGHWLVTLRGSWLDSYDLRTARKVAGIPAGKIEGMTVANDGAVVVLRSDTATLYRRGEARGACSTGRYATGAVFSPDSQLFMTWAPEDPYLRLWRTEDCRDAGLIPSTPRFPTFSADSRTVLITDWQKVRRWNISARRFDEDVSIDVLATWYIATHENTMATAHNDGRIRLTRLDRNETPVALRGPHKYISSLAFSPDGLWLASGDSEGHVALWNLTTNQLIGTPIETGQGDLRFVAFSADGRSLVTRSTHGHFKRWNLDADAWSAKACLVAQRNPTCAEWQRVLGTEPYRRTCPALPPPRDAAQCGAR